MRRIQKSLLPASIVLGAAVAAGGFIPALAQGTDGTLTDAPAEVEVEVEAETEIEIEAGAEVCADGEDCTEAEYAPDEAEVVEAEVEEVPADAAPAEPVTGAASDGAVLAAPGTTDESNPGGSTRPGTTPDD